MSKTLSVDELLAGLPDAASLTEELELPSGGTIVVRALSSSAHRQMMRKATLKSADFDVEVFERLLLVYGILQPQLTRKQAQALQQKQMAAVQHILAAIRRLSGLDEFGNITKVAVDEAEQSFREEPSEIL